MKKIILTFLIPFGILSLSAQNQDEYTAYLTQALKAIDNGNDNGFDTNLRYFATAIEKNQITPETLTETNLKLYTKCLYEAYINEIYLQEDLVQKALQFIEYDIENRPENMVALGVLYEEGLSVPQDYQQAQHWFEKAAQKGNPDAMIRLVYFYSSNEEKNDAYFQEKAVETYKKQAEKGDSEAMFKLSIAYGSPLALDESNLSDYWLKKSAENGNTKAMYMLGYQQLVGIYGEENHSESVQWFEKAAEQGHVKAMFYLGDIYYSGNGNVTQDDKKAKHWFTQACDNGYSDACYYYQ